MIPSLNEVGGSCGAYIDAVSRRQATQDAAAGGYHRATDDRRYDNFTKMNPI